MIKADFKIDQRFKKRLMARYGRYEFSAGILKDKPHRRAKSASHGTTSYEGGPVRKKSSKIDGTVAQVAERIRKLHQVNYLLAPFKKKNSTEMRLFAKAFMSLITEKTSAKKPVEVALQNVIRTPILRKKYGRNSKWWANIKTFNRKLFDTGQFYQNIIAKVGVRRVSK